jgi:hypothetical protein
LPLAGAPIDTVCRQGLLHFLPEIVIDDRGVLAWIGLLFMHDLAAIDAVLQHVIERPPSNRLAPIGLAIGRRAALADDARSIEVLLEQAHRRPFHSRTKCAPALILWAFSGAISPSDRRACTSAASLRLVALLSPP